MSSNILNGKRKGQIHISESILVLFVLILIILAGMVIYFRFSIEKVKDAPYELSERESTILLAKITNMDEVSCSEMDCLDAGKFLPFQRAMGKESMRFNRIFGRKKITVYRIFPEVRDELKDVECGISNYIQVEYPENCGKWTIYEHNPENELGGKISSVVSLYFPEMGEYMVGRVEVEHYGDVRR
jgi:hypothetical protein